VQQSPKNNTNKCILTSYKKQKLIDKVTFFKLPIVLIVIYVIVAPTLWLYASFIIVIIFNIILDYMYFKVKLTLILIVIYVIVAPTLWLYALFIIVINFQHNMGLYVFQSQTTFNINCDKCSYCSNSVIICIINCDYLQPIE